MSYDTKTNQSDLNSEDEEDLLPSKSELKRQAKSVLDLVKQLFTLNATSLATLQLDENIADAVAKAKIIHSHSAAKRHRMYTAKLLRQSDISKLTEQLVALKENTVAQTAQFHLAEQWRDRLLEGSRDDLTQFISEYPATNNQQLRQLIKKSNDEIKLAKPPQTKRKLFKFLKTIIDESSED